VKHLIKTSIFSLLLALLPLAAFATAKMEKKNITLDQSALIAGKQLKPGEYKLEWNNSQPNTSVTFLKGKKTIVTVPAQIVKKNNIDNASFEFNTAHHQNRLDRVYLSHEYLQFGQKRTKTAS
jgi:hypothetical protein